MTNLDVNASLIKLLLPRQLNIWREQLAKKIKVRCSLGHNKVVRVFQTMPEKVALLAFKNSLGPKRCCDHSFQSIEHFGDYNGLDIKD